MPATEVPFIDRRFWPSVLQQSAWECSFFNFRKLEREDTAYFNCGLVERTDGLWLIVRRSRNEKGVRIGFNDVIAFLLDEEEMRPEFGRAIKFPVGFDKEHFEDPRAIYFGGRTYVSCCNFLVFRNGRAWSGAHQVIGRIDKTSKDDWSVSARFDPVFGNNGERIGKDEGMEKNWLWFFHEGAPHLLYEANPMTVVRFDNQFKPEYTHKAQPTSLPWNYGTVRGGTPPVLSLDGKEYWTFFHSSLKTGDQYHRRYYMGAYAFEAQPPFAITRFTTEPLLVGSQQDPWSPRKPLVVFPCGARLKNDEWLISFGVNDLKSAWIKIPHADIEERASVLRQVSGARKTLIQRILPARMKLRDVTLACVDDNRPELAQKAIAECTRRIGFKAVKYFTSHSGYPNSIKTPPIRTLEDYSRFIVKDMRDYIKSSHVLVCQWDGYIVNANAWTDEFLHYDYVGGVWKHNGQVGNGGFSLRSRKLLDALAAPQFGPPYMPEDHYIAQHRRAELESEFGIRFAPPELAAQFAVENAPYSGQFGFHSFISALPKNVARPLIFHHTGDAGDIIYGLAAIKALGGGVLFVSPNSKYTVRVSPTNESMANLLPLLNQQPYVWKAQFTGEIIDHADYDLNRFRDYYANGNKEIGESLVSLQMRSCGIPVVESPWLSVDFPVSVPNAPIVISRSTRYHNLDFPWKALVKQHGKSMIFIGTDGDHSEFMREFGYVLRFPTATLLDAARVISGAACFIGNQNACMAVALGLGVNVIQEVWDGSNVALGDLNVPWDGKTTDPNCRLFSRKNALYVKDGRAEIPKEWLA